MNIDRFDRKILQALQKDGRISNVDLADLVSLSESACLRRVRRLEEDGFIDKYTALLNQHQANLAGMCLYILLCFVRSKVTSPHSKLLYRTCRKSWSAIS